MIKRCFHQHIIPSPVSKTLSDAIIYRVLTVHGSMDKVVPVEDAMEFAKFISNHKLHIIEGADHEYTSHQDELASVVLNFVRTHVHQDGDMSEQLPLRTGVRSIHSRL